ncbi:MAG: hypothetical protein R3C12_04065 [Planctomycetaceae bacterium]
MLGIARLPVEADALIPLDDRLLVSEHLFCSVTLLRTSVRPVARVTGNVSGSLDQLRYLKTISNAFRGRRKTTTLLSTTQGSSHFVTVDEYSLYIAHDAAFIDDWSGQIHYRFLTPDAQKRLITRDGIQICIGHVVNPKWRITKRCTPAVK